MVIKKFENTVKKHLPICKYTRYWIIRRLENTPTFYFWITQATLNKWCACIVKHECLKQYKIETVVNSCGFEHFCNRMQWIHVHITRHQSYNGMLYEAHPSSALHSLLISPLYLANVAHILRTAPDP